jgi:hypothetical protein
MKKLVLAVAGLALALSSCANNDDAGPTVPGSLEVTRIDAGGLAGSFTNEGETLTFEASTISERVYEVSITVHGLTLDAMIDFQNGVQSLDGYSTADGLDTMMVDEDRVAVLVFVKALEQQFPDIADMEGAPNAFDSIANVWAEWIPAMPLAYTKVFAADRTVSWCDYIGSYRYTSHDCWSSGNMGVNAYVGSNGTCGDDAWLWNNSSGTWDVCADQNHDWNRTYATGNCYARCGEGCGSGTTYTKECADHDQCVRNGHWVSSSWCSDELNDACWGDCWNCGRN